VLAVHLPVTVLRRLKVCALAAWLALPTSVRIHIGIFFIVRIFDAVHAFAVSTEDFVLATNA
jgi:hypothetical protein